MNKLYIVRHGKTDWNTKNLIQGLTDVDLNKIGVEESKELSKKLNLDKIDICISSPLKRAIKTAEILVDNKIGIIKEELLKERSFGSYEGSILDKEKICMIWNYKLNNKDYNIESIKECLDRASKFLKKISKKYNNKNILIVSHGSFIKALHFNIVGYDENTDFLSFNPKNTVIYEYKY